MLYVCRAHPNSGGCRPAAPVMLRGRSGAGTEANRAGSGASKAGLAGVPVPVLSSIRSVNATVRGARPANRT